MFFDRGCPLCRREIAPYRRLDTAGAIDWRDSHADARVLEEWGMPRDRAMQRMHATTPEGGLQRGPGLRAGVAAFAVLPLAGQAAASPAADRLVAGPGL